jgi:shikimate dehydrogenase
MVYLCMPVPSHDLQSALQGCRAARFVGSNVTIPHKQAVHALVDEVSERARAVGAVNTIVSRGDAEAGGVSLYGDNTDVQGFLDPMQGLGASLDAEEMVVLGSGGAARAVIYALLTTYAPTRLTIVARSPEKADKLAQDLAGYDRRKALRVAEPAEMSAALRACRLLVNTTPLGMPPNEHLSPIKEPGDLGDGHIVYDLVYNPLTTRLMREAKGRGATVLGGLDMLVHQAAASYVQWTGQEMPIEVARRAALQALA